MTRFIELHIITINGCAGKPIYINVDKIIGIYEEDVHGGTIIEFGSAESGYYRVYESIENVTELLKTIKDVNIFRKV